MFYNLAETEKVFRLIAGTRRTRQKQRRASKAAEGIRVENC